MVGSIELQYISKILTCNDESFVDELCNYDASYFALCKEHMQFILDHRAKYGRVPDTFTFQAKFENFQFIEVNETLEYLTQHIKENKQRILLNNLFNYLGDLGEDDVGIALEFTSNIIEQATMLGDNKPMDIIGEALKRTEQVVEWSKQERIPTGFPEIDKLTYGGLSTVEELIAFVARSNTGKSWLCVRLMEAAQRAGFNVAYYSPEMQAAYLATRFDTWRGHYRNSNLFRGDYDQAYLEYIRNMSDDESAARAYIIEDKDMPEGVSPRHLEAFVKKHNIRLLIIDGISYLRDDQKAYNSHDKYEHICHDLFQLSKKYGCAVAIAVQANRDTKNTKDEKGVPFPTLYDISGSDAIGQICTQVYSLRQIFDKHVFEIKLLKTRMAANGNDVLSYSWDVNTGNMQYLPGGADEDPVINMPDTSDILTPSEGPVPEGLKGIIDLDDTDDVEF